MLEILILVRLGQSISAKAREKGRQGWPYVFLLLALWFGGEVFGGVTAALVTAGLDDDGEPNLLIAYLACLVCAAVGAFFAFKIVGALPPVESWDDEDRAAGRDDRDWRASDE